VDGLELRVASIQAIADKERELKNTYIADRKKANEILCAYQRLLSREHGLESPANCADSATAVELVSALIADVNTIAYQYKEKLTRGDKKNIEDTKTELIKLKEENQNLLLELEKLRISKDGNNIKNTPGDQKPTEIDNFFDQLSEVFAHVPNVEVPVIVSPPKSSYQAAHDNSLGTRILKLAGESNFEIERSINPMYRNHETARNGN
jgi:regulator of replication initiation timing